ncbi:uncharacterized protein LOC144663782 isoform X1 [Oculina patagonica]
MRVAVAFILLISLAVVMAFTTEKERPVYEDEPDGTSPGLPRDKRQRFIYTGDESEEDNLPSILEGDENEEDDKVESLKKRILWSKSRLLLHAYLFCYSSRLLPELREVNNPRRGNKISLRLLKHLSGSITRQQA